MLLGNPSSRCLRRLAGSRRPWPRPAIDDAREDRWAQEVVPGIVVGDAVWLATPSRAKVLAIFAVAGGRPKGGVILIHGLGVHPDFGDDRRPACASGRRGLCDLVGPDAGARRRGAARGAYSIALPAAARADRRRRSPSFERGNIAPDRGRLAQLRRIDGGRVISRDPERRASTRGSRSGCSTDLTKWIHREPPPRFVAASDSRRSPRRRRSGRGGCRATDARATLTIDGADHYFEDAAEGARGCGRSLSRSHLRRGVAFFLFFFFFFFFKKKKKKNLRSCMTRRSISIIVLAARRTREPVAHREPRRHPGARSRPG